MSVGYKLTNQVYKKFDHKCALCESTTKTQVHHRTYARRGNEDLEDLTLLCRDCHRIFHENSRLESLKGTIEQRKDSSISYTVNIEAFVVDTNRSSVWLSNITSNNSYRTLHGFNKTVISNQNHGVDASKWKVGDKVRFSLFNIDLESLPTIEEKYEEPKPPVRSNVQDIDIF